MAKARKYNTSYSLGVIVGGGAPLALVSGAADRASGEAMTPEALIPLGSAQTRASLSLSTHVH
jgi:hypothetical protein